MRLISLILLVLLYLFPGNSEVTYGIAPLLAAGAIGLGSKLLGGLFGKKKSSAPANPAAQFYQDVLKGGGYLPGQKDQLIGDTTRQLGAQANLQAALLNERLAAVPGASGTAFGDAARNQLVRGRQDALQNAVSNINQQGIQNQFNAAGALYGGEEAGKQRKAGLFSSIGGGLLSAGGAIGGALISKSSKTYKKNIKPADPEKLLKAVKKVSVKKFKYKDGLPEADGKEHLGPIIENSPNEIKFDDKHMSIPNTVSTLLGAVKALSKKIDHLEGAKHGL